MPKVLLPKVLLPKVLPCGAGELVGPATIAYMKRVRRPGRRGAAAGSPRNRQNLPNTRRASAE